MKQQFTAVVKQDEGWWIGWVEEIPGVNSQGKTRRELMKNLRSALKEAIEMNRVDARSAASGNSRRSAVPRHSEINRFLARKICRDLGISEP